MKYLLLISLLLMSGCQKDSPEDCALVDVFTSHASKEIAKNFECSELEVTRTLLIAGRKLPFCGNKGTQYAGLNAGEFKCTLAPLLIRSLGDAVTAKWQCKKVGSSLSEMLLSALKCN